MKTMVAIVVGVELLSIAGYLRADEADENQPYSSYFCEWQQDRGRTDCSKRAYDELDTQQTIIFNNYREARENQEQVRKMEERDARFKAVWLRDLRSKPIADLCDAIHGDYDKEARAELKRRHIFSAAQWKRIDEGMIRIGDPESMIRCSWGAPAKTNSTITAGWVSRQYVYDHSFVYTSNGIVDAIQN